MSKILCVGGVAHGKRIEYIGRKPEINGDRYVLHRVDGIEVYRYAPVGFKALDRAYRELVK